MSSKIYTKTGDKGKTSLLGCSKVSKADVRIASYGTIDELNAFVAHLHDHEGITEEVKIQLLAIQHDLFTLGSLLAAEADFKRFKLPTLESSDVLKLEDWIDKYDEELPELKNFILPAGHKTVSLCHVCRTICRRAERGIAAIEGDARLGENILPYVNRLSDYFFTLSRKIQKDLNIDEIPWKPRS